MELENIILSKVTEVNMRRGTGTSVKISER
jgi:hypothetical protein